MSGDDVCSSVVFGTLVGVFVFSVMWSELLMTSAISCPLWSSVYECQGVECGFTSPVRTECGGGSKDLGLLVVELSGDTQSPANRGLLVVELSGDTQSPANRDQLLS